MVEMECISRNMWKLHETARSPTMGSWAASPRDSPSTAVMWQRRAVTLGNIWYN